LHHFSFIFISHLHHFSFIFIPHSHHYHFAQMLNGTLQLNLCVSILPLLLACSPHVKHFL
jgi:hypothetical protein